MQSDITKQIFENYNDFQKISIPLLVLLTLNLFAFLGKFISDLIIKNRDRQIYKINIIASRKIDIQEKLYQRLDALSLFTNNEKELFFDKIKEAEIFINQNKLYLDNKLHKQSNKILDYYKSIYFDFRKKKYEEEIIMLDEYARIFHK